MVTWIVLVFGVMLLTHYSDTLYKHSSTQISNLPHYYKTEEIKMHIKEIHDSILFYNWLHVAISNISAKILCTVNITAQLIKMTINL